MKHIVFLFFLLNITYLSTGQVIDDIHCATTIENDVSALENGPCLEYFDYYYDLLDHVQMHDPVFHFVNYDYDVSGIETITVMDTIDDNGEIVIITSNMDVSFTLPAVEFICIDDPNDSMYLAENNAFRIAKRIIDKANQISSNLEPCIPGGGVLPNNDFKVRYTEVVDCSDIIILENEGDIQDVSGKFNIRILNVSNTSFGTGGALRGEAVDLRNIGNKIVHPNRTYSPFSYGGVVNHEMGHAFGLCHAQAAGNTCVDYPNTLVCADGAIDSNCNANSNGSFCDSGGKNNTMTSGAARQAGFTPCQFMHALPVMSKSNSSRTAFLNACPDIIIDKPQETTYLECDLYVCGRLIVKTGSELVLRGRLEMNQNSEIIVERGARFIIESGKIAGKIPTPGYWEGIKLTDGYTGQVNVTTTIVDYPSLAPASLVVTGASGLSIIEHAKIAINSRESPIGTLGGITSLIHLDGLLLKDNEVGMVINNSLNQRPINAQINNVIFFQSSNDDLKIISGEDVDIRNCIFSGSAPNGITLIDAELSGFNDCTVKDKAIGIDIKCTYPYHPGFKLGDESGISNEFLNNTDAVHIGGGVGVGNTEDLEVFRARFLSGFLGVRVVGNAGYEIHNSEFPSVRHGVFSAFSGAAENVIHCNQFNSPQDGFGIASMGNNRNLTLHSNDFDMSNLTSRGIWRFSGDVFQVQSANFDFINPTVANNPPAGNQFFDVAVDLNFFENGNTVDYLVPQDGAGMQYYPKTEGNYNEIVAIPDIVDCPEDVNLSGGGIGTVVPPNPFVPNDSTGTWPIPIGDPIALDEYLDDLIIFLDPTNLGDPTRAEISRVRFALYRWVVHMLAHPGSYNLSAIEDFVDDDYRRLMVGYYIHTGDPFNADRVLSNLPRVKEVNSDFAAIQYVNLRRLFPAFYNHGVPYSPSAAELSKIRNIAEKHSENTGYASSLYYLYTQEKVFPDFYLDPIGSRNSHEINKDELMLDVYPNPSSETIDLNSNMNMSNYTLYDSFGRVQVSNVVNNKKIFNLDISDLPAGIYFLEVKSGEHSITKKVVRI